MVIVILGNINTIGFLEKIHLFILEDSTVSVVMFSDYSLLYDLWFREKVQVSNRV